MGFVNDLTNISLVLVDRKKGKPDLNLFIHCVDTNPDWLKTNPIMGADISVTNISKSAFSVSLPRLNGKEALLPPLVRIEDEGIRYIEKFEGEYEYTPRAIAYDSKLPYLPPLPSILYLEPLASIRGLVFWEGDFTSAGILEIACVILSENKTIFTSIR